MQACGFGKPWVDASCCNRPTHQCCTVAKCDSTTKTQKRNHSSGWLGKNYRGRDRPGAAKTPSCSSCASWRAWFQTPSLVRSTFCNRACHCSGLTERTKNSPPLLRTTRSSSRSLSWQSTIVRQPGQLHRAHRNSSPVSAGLCPAVSTSRSKLPAGVQLTMSAKELNSRTQPSRRLAARDLLT